MLYISRKLFRTEDKGIDSEKNGQSMLPGAEIVLGGCDFTLKQAEAQVELLYSTRLEEVAEVQEAEDQAGWGQLPAAFTLLHDVSFAILQDPNIQKERVKLARQQEEGSERSCRRFWIVCRSWRIWPARRSEAPEWCAWAIEMRGMKRHLRRCCSGLQTEVSGQVQPSLRASALLEAQKIQKQRGT